LAVSRDTGDHNHVEYCVGEREAFGHSAYVAQRVNIRRGHGIFDHLGGGVDAYHLRFLVGRDDPGRQSSGATPDVQDPARARDVEPRIPQYRLVNRAVQHSLKLAGVIIGGPAVEPASRPRTRDIGSRR
jgi:hypothetical protein